MTRRPTEDSDPAPSKRLFFLSMTGFLMLVSMFTVKGFSEESFCSQEVVGEGFNQEEPCLYSSLRNPYDSTLNTAAGKSSLVGGEEDSTLEDEGGMLDSAIQQHRRPPASYVEHYFTGMINKNPANQTPPEGIDSEEEFNREDEVNLPSQFSAEGRDPIIEDPSSFQENGN